MKWRKVFQSAATAAAAVGSHYSLCRNFGGLFDEPMCFINREEPFDVNLTLASCGVPICPSYFGPNAGKMCKVTQSGREGESDVCVPFRDYLPPSTWPLCNVTDKIEGPTYTWAHPTHGYSLTIPSAARPCHNLRRAVLVKGGYYSRIWFEIPVIKDYIDFKIHPYSEEELVELVVQYRYSPDRADQGYNMGLTSRHFHVFHAQHLVGLSKGHLPIVTDYAPLFR